MGALIPDPVTEASSTGRTAPSKADCSGCRRPAEAKERDAHHAAPDNRRFPISGLSTGGSARRPGAGPVTRNDTVSQP